MNTDPVPQPTMPTAQQTWGLLDVLLVAVPLLALTFFAQVNGTSEARPTRPINPLYSALFLSAIEAALILPVWLLAILKSHGSWRAIGFRSFDAAKGWALPFVYLVVAFVVSGLWGLVLQALHLPTQQEIAPLFGGSPLALVLGYVAAAVVAPIAEETVFRGFVIGGLRRRFGLSGAVILSAVFFALLHPPLTIFPVIFALGLLLGLLFAQTGSLYPGMFMHAMFNTIGYIAQVALTNNSAR